MSSAGKAFGGEESLSLLAERGELRRVLCLRAARVGDTLHVRPALELLRQALPEAELTWLCSEYAAPAARGAAVDHLVPYRHKGRSPAAYLARRKARARLASLGPFDLCLGLEDKAWGRRLAQELGIPRFHAASSGGVHVVERKAQVLAAAGLWELGAPPPEIRWSPLPTADAQVRAALAGAPKPWIGLQVGSHATRRLRAPRRRRDPSLAWLGVQARALQAAFGGSLILHAGLGGAETRQARALHADLREAGLRVRLLADLDLEALGAALGALDAFVTSNTGPAHLAAAQGTPLVLLDGPSPATAHPWRVPDSCRVLSLKLPCSPCSGTAEGRACRIPRCLDALDAQDLVQALGELLAPAPQIPPAL